MFQAAGWQKSQFDFVGALIDPLFNLFSLSLKNISAKWALTIPNWASALSHFTTEFADRNPQSPTCSYALFSQGAMNPDRRSTVTIESTDSPIVC